MRSPTANWSLLHRRLFINSVMTPFSWFTYEKSVFCWANNWSELMVTWQFSSCARTDPIKQLNTSKIRIAFIIADSVNVCAGPDVRAICVGA